MGNDSFSLTLSDSDGERPIVLLKSNGNNVSFLGASGGGRVSFESGKPAIYRQGNQQEKATSKFCWLNSSQHGRQMANLWLWFCQKMVTQTSI